MSAWKMGECVACGRTFRLLRSGAIPAHDRATGSTGQVTIRCGGVGLAPAD